jgi:hypothetical protein
MDDAREAAQKAQNDIEPKSAINLAAITCKTLLSIRYSPFLDWGLTYFPIIQSTHKTDKLTPILSSGK